MGYTDYQEKSKFSNDFKKMVAACLIKDPTKRPTAAKLLAMSFFKKVCYHYLSSFFPFLSTFS
jgi:hypothetical protein